jgi:hypothetical protein
MATIKRFLCIFLGAAVLAAASFPATAMLLNVRGGILYGASAVPVGDRLFDVEFVRTAYPPDDFFPHMEGFNSYLAMAALLEFVIIDSPLGAFDSNPSLVESDCPYTDHCWLAVPWGINAENGALYFGYIQNGPTEGDDFLSFGRCYQTVVNDCPQAWTRWSNRAPEPTTVFLLLAAGLVWLVMRGVGGPCSRLGICSVSPQ